MRNLFRWACALIIAVVFVWGAYNKFNTNPDSTYIFTQVGAWLQGVKDTIPAFAHGFVDSFEPQGRLAVAGAEVLAAALVINPNTRRLGGLVALVVLIGALAAHLAGGLGVEVAFPSLATEANAPASAATPTDGGMLFGMAAVSALAAVALVFGRSE